MMRLVNNKQRVEMDESDFKEGNYILSFETEEKTIFKMFSKDGKVLQAI